MLTQSLTRDQLVEDKLGNGSADSLTNLASLVPTMDDEFIQRLLEKVHMFDMNNFQIAGDTMLQALLETLMLNPYNACRFIEALYILAVNNIQPRTGFDHPLLDIDVFDSNLQDCASACNNYTCIAPLNGGS